MRESESRAILQVMRNQKFLGKASSLSGMLQVDVDLALHGTWY